MGTTTFSGPIKAGTIREGSSKNTGSVVMAQSIAVDIVGANSANQVCATIPANSQIVDVILNVTQVNNDAGAANVTIGTASDPDAFLAATDVKTLATTHGTLDTEATDVGSSDLQVLADYVSANENSTTGAGTVTVLYIQNNNLS